MMTITGFLIFAAGFGAAAWVLGATLLPALPRIIAILRGEDDPAITPQPVLVLSERRVRARVRAMPVRAIPAPLRAVA